MSVTQVIKGRIINKHGTEADWLAAGTAAAPFIPLDGELIIYDPDSNYSYKRIKFGDGVTAVHLLPFYAEGATASEQVQSDWLIADATNPGYIKNKPEIPSAASFEQVTNKIKEINASATDTQYPSAKAVRTYVEEHFGTVDTSLVIDYKFPLTWNGSTTGLTTVAIDDSSVFCKVSSVACQHAAKFTEGNNGSGSFGVVADTLYSPTAGEDYYVYSVNGIDVAVATLKDSVVYNEMTFPLKGTYFKVLEASGEKIWISKIVQEVIEYNRDDLANVVVEVANNKVTEITDSETEDQYPTVSAVKGYVTEQIPAAIENSGLEFVANKITSLNGEVTSAQYPSASAVKGYVAARELISNKVSSIEEDATDDQYPSVKAVKDYVEAGSFIPDLTGYEKTENRVTAISSSATDNTYPTAKATKTYVDSKVSGREYSSNKVTEITENATNTQYPSALAVKNYIANSVIIPDLTGYEKTENKVTTFNSVSDTTYPTSKAVSSYVSSQVRGKESSANKVTSITESATDTQYPSAKAVKTYVENNVILPDLSGYELSANKVTSLDTVSDATYPSSKAIKDYVDNAIPDVSGFEEVENRVETINDLSSHLKYPSALAVKNYVDDTVETLNTFQENFLTDYATEASWSGDTTGLAFLTNLYYGTSFYRIVNTPIVGAITGVTLTESGGTTSYEVTVDGEAVFDPSVSNTYVYMYNCGQADPLIVSVLKDNAAYGDYIFPLRGTYFMLRDYSSPYGKLWVSKITVLETNYNHQDLPDILLEVANNKVDTIDDSATDAQYPTVNAVRAFVNEHTPEKELPEVTTTDAGKFLRVSAEGAWAAESITNAEEVTF